MKYLIGVISLLLVNLAVADEIVQGFKNPSFSGIGTSAHYLTIENQEKSRKDQIKDDIESALKAAQREQDNTTLAKFIRNLESRIFAQLSKQLVDNMFGTNCDATTTTCPDSGTAVVEGATIAWAKNASGTTITLTVTDTDGTVSTLTVPIGDFVF